MTNEQTAILLQAIVQFVRETEAAAMDIIPDGDSKPDEISVKSRVQNVFYRLEGVIERQLATLAGRF